jgi:hypothetical protein
MKDYTCRIGYDYKVIQCTHCGVMLSPSNDITWDPGVVTPGNNQIKHVEPDWLILIWPLWTSIMFITGFVMTWHQAASSLDIVGISHPKHHAMCTWSPCVTWFIFIGITPISNLVLPKFTIPPEPTEHRGYDRCGVERQRNFGASLSTTVSGSQLLDHIPSIGKIEASRNIPNSRG